jgi:hypothetical protein
MGGGPIRARCTRSKRGRRIECYAGDEEKEALRRVMEHPLFETSRVSVTPRQSTYRPWVESLHHYRPLRLGPIHQAGRLRACARRTNAKHSIDGVEN